jgi:hypothetical protein
MKLALKNDSYFSCPENDLSLSIIVGQDKLGLEFDSATSCGIRVQLNDERSVDVSTVRLGFYGLAAKEALTALVECSKALYLQKPKK